MLRALTLATQHNVAIHKAQHEASNIWRSKKEKLPQNLLPIWLISLEIR